MRAAEGTLTRAQLRSLAEGLASAQAGESFDFGPSDIHYMSHAGGGPAISIHAYSPPLQRMGAYDVDTAGVLRRAPISYTEELRPALGVAA